MIEWREAYNCHTAVVAGGAIKLNVVWNSTAPKGSPSGYVVSVNNRTLKNLIPDLVEGKKAAVRLARKILTEAFEEIKEEAFE